MTTRAAPAKADFPVDQVRHYLEPGPVVLVTSAWNGERDVMTMGWHTVMEFTPSLIGCVIARGNHTHGLVRNSGECAINIPDASLVDTVVGIGNCSGTDVDKFERFGLVTEPGSRVQAPLLRDCFAQFECRVTDARMVSPYGFFIFEVLRAWVAPRPRHPRTLHYQGDGQFVISGKSISRRGQFAPEML